MKVLHLFPENNKLIADHVAMLREHEELSDDKVDIVHVHGCWNSDILRKAARAHNKGVRIVLSPHGELESWVKSEQPVTKKAGQAQLLQRLIVKKSYVLIAHGPLETEALKELGWNPRIETIRNAVITNSITPEAMRQHTQEVYRKVMDSYTLALMNDNGRRLLTLLLKGGITGDRRWLSETEIPTIDDMTWRQLLVYADHENVRTTIDRGIHVLGIHAPYVETAKIKSYLPTDYTLPKVENHSVEGIVSEMKHGPLTLRQIVELDNALRRPSVNEEEIIEILTEKRMIKYFQHILQLLTETTLLDEGFLPLKAISDKQTAKLRRQLEEHLRI